MLIGLTGGMGCGKSAALDCFAELGYTTTDADSICHMLYNDSRSSLFKKLYKRWGSRIISETNTIDRKIVSRIAFSDVNELKWLNSVVHPAVLEEGLRVNSNSEKKITFFDVPLLFEAGWDRYCDATITVWCKNEIRIKRLKKRGMTEEEIKKRDMHQMQPEEKIEKADYAIINNSSLLHLKQQCEIIVKELN